MEQLETTILCSGWFSQGRTRPETVEMFKKFGHTEFQIYETILNMHRRKILYTFPSKAGIRYRLTVQADLEMDIGI